MSIGTRIKDARLHNGITQEELARQIGVTKGAIANYENGVSTPKIELMFKLISKLGIDANYLYQDDMDIPQEATSNGQYQFTDYELSIILAYRIASEDDQMIVDTALRKYIAEDCLKGDAEKMA